MIKKFENFKNDLVKEVVVLNPRASSLVEEALTTEEKLQILESNGFLVQADFLILDEALNVKYEGHEGDMKIFVSVNGHKYAYTKKEDGIDLGDIARKFEKMLQFSAGRALQWLKKNTELVSGSKSQEEADLKQIKESHDESHNESENYMFFGNLMTIKKCIEKMMALEPSRVDTLLKNGHDWASDHIATSKDDIEEVCNWLCNQMDSNNTNKEEI
jgi:hypothetical protein